MTDLTATDNLPAVPDESIELAAGRVEVERLLRAAAMRLGELVDRYPADLAGQARAHQLIVHMRSDLGIVLDATTRNLVANMPGKQLIVDGVGVFEMKTSVANSEWDHPHLWAQVSRFARARAISGDGEALYDDMPAFDAGVGAAITEAQEMLQRGGWSKTALRARGIDPDDVSKQVWGKKTLRYTETGR